MSTQAGERILAATAELLVEVSWERVTMEAIADRAGVGKATIYRRWSSKEEVVLAVVNQFHAAIELPDRGSLEEDLRAVLVDAIRVYRSPRGRLVPALASAMTHSPRLNQAVQTKVLGPRREAVLEVFRRARRRGEVEPQVDLDLLHDLLAGPIVYRHLFTAMPLDPELVDELVEAITAAARPSRPQNR